MERLTEPVIVDEEEPTKTFYFVNATALESLKDRVTPTSEYFGLFLAVDASLVEEETVREVATALLRRGLVCLCVWGTNCERIHDLFDEADRPIHPDHWAGETGDVVMTTCHEGESLEYSLWYFTFCAYPTASYQSNCKDWIVVSVSSEEWTTAIREKLPKIVLGEIEPADG